MNSNLQLSLCGVQRPDQQGRDAHDAPFCLGSDLQWDVRTGTLRCPRCASPVASQDRGRHFLLLVIVPKPQKLGIAFLSQLRDCVQGMTTHPCPPGAGTLPPAPRLPGASWGVRADGGSRGLTTVPSLAHLPAQHLSPACASRRCRTCSLPGHQPRPSPTAAAEPRTLGLAFGFYLSLDRCFSE